MYSHKHWVRDFEKWFNEKMAKQLELKDTEEPAFTAEDVVGKFEGVEALVNKLDRKRKPKPKPAPKAENATAGEPADKAAGDKDAKAKVEEKEKEQQQEGEGIEEDQQQQEEGVEEHQQQQEGEAKEVQEEEEQQQQQQEGGERVEEEQQQHGHEQQLDQGMVRNGYFLLTLEYLRLDKMYRAALQQFQAIEAQGEEGVLVAANAFVLGTLAEDQTQEERGDDAGEDDAV